MIAAGLLVVTCISVFVVYLFQWQNGVEAGGAGSILRSAQFTVTLMGILITHELGHSVMARRHGMPIGLPWFLPFPFLVGTLGAVIRLRGRPRSRLALMELGAGGPLAGLAVIILVILLRMARPYDLPPESDYQLASPLIWTFLAWAMGAGELAVSTRDPLAFAAWIGCLVTAMNLLPFGQLDGGHVMRALAPRAANGVTWAIAGILAALGFVWKGWWAWLLLLLLLGTSRSMEVPDEAVPGPWWSLSCAAAFVLCFTPRPLG